VWDSVYLVRRPLIGLLYLPRMIDDDECGAVGGMRIGRGNRSTRRKPATVPLCPPQIPHDLTWSRTQAAAVGSRRLTAWAMARPGLRLTWLVRQVRMKVSVATRLPAGRPGFDSRQQLIFLYSTVSRLAFGPSKPSIGWVPWALPRG
jgi:hypothetical protein